MDNSFRTKWGALSKISSGDDKLSERMFADERTLFVPEGREPLTQRQLNLYYYFIFVKKVLDEIGVRRALEIGCGRGTMSLYLAAYLGIRMTLLDNIEDAVGLARQDFARLGIKADFLVGNALSLPFGGASFDAVVSIGLAEHFESGDVESLFCEQYRVLRPGGVMVSLNIPRKFSIQALNTFIRLVKKSFGMYKESIVKDYFRNSLSPGDYKDAAERVGFKKISMIHVCPFPLYTPISPRADRAITKFNKAVLALRGLFQKYPYKTNHFLAQAHFLVGRK